MSHKLSVIIPCYNEKDTVLELIQRVESVDLGSVEKELVIIDDASSDGSRELLLEHAGDHTILLNDRNLGKGASLRKGFEHASGDIIIIQDADLEYDPEDYPSLIQPIIDKECKVVYGSRERNEANKRHSGWHFYAGGRLLSALTNLLYGSKLTDEPCCYKTFDRDTLMQLDLRCKRFEFCPEVTAKLLRQGVHIKEVPVSYNPRKPNEGKKINWRDGLEAIWTLVRLRFRP